MAGGYCAAELRKRGADGSILLAGREPEPPYERPALSKDYLRGESGREDGKGLHVHTVRQIHALLSSASRWAVRKKKVDHNVALDTDALRARRSEEHRRLILPTRLRRGGSGGRTRT